MCMCVCVRVKDYLFTVLPNLGSNRAIVQSLCFSQFFLFSPCNLFRFQIRLVYSQNLNTAQLQATINPNSLQFTARQYTGFSVGRHNFNLGNISSLVYNPQAGTGFDLRLRNQLGNRVVFRTPGAIFSASLQYASPGLTASSLPPSLVAVTTVAFAVVEFTDVTDLNKQPVVLEPDFAHTGPGTGVFHEPGTSNWFISLAITSKPFPTGATFTGINIRFIHSPISSSGGLQQRRAAQLPAATTFALTNVSSASVDYIFLNE